MKTIDLYGAISMEPVRGGTGEWYWATDYIHGDLYEAQELFEQGHPVQSNRLLLIHYPDGTVYEPIESVPWQYLGYPVYDGGSIVLLAVSFAEGLIRILRFDAQRNGTEEIARLPLSAVENCYNLILHTAPLTLTRHPHDCFEIVWPERKRFAVEVRESFNFREGDRLYFTMWYEDPDYREETIVRALQDGAILERYPGDIRVMPNGDKWLIQ